MKKGAGLCGGWLVVLVAVAGVCADEPERASAQICLDRVAAIHGTAGPWAVVGYRMGERALAELKLPRHSHDIQVIHRSPAKVQYACVADGVQAATGASPGKLNLRFEEVALEEMCTLIRHADGSGSLRMTLRPEFARSISSLPKDQLAAEGRRVAELDDEEMFEVSEIPN